MNKDTVLEIPTQERSFDLNDVLSDVEPVQADKTSLLANKLEGVRVDPLEILSPPETCLEIVSEDVPATVATLGNFMLLIGKAKSRKTFLILIFLSSFIAGKILLEKISGTLRTGKNRAILFDTEQGKYHLQRTVNRICKMTGNANPDNFQAFGLRKYKAQERLNLIEYKIYNTPDLGLVVIDGIRDLVTSINDEEQASNMSSLLLKWTDELKIHIIVVLHQNKNDNNARGHLGAELVNKAESTLSVTKSPQDKGISVVEAEYCRDKEPEPFAFEIDDNGLPVLAENWEARTASKKNGRDNMEIEDFKKFQLLNSLYTKQDTYTYAELWVSLQKEYQKQIGVKLSDARAKKLVASCKAEGWVTQNGNRQPYKLGQYNNDNP